MTPLNMYMSYSKQLPVRVRGVCSLHRVMVHTEAYVQVRNLIEQNSRLWKLVENG